MFVSDLLYITMCFLENEIIQTMLAKEKGKIKEKKDNLHPKPPKPLS
jgi:hypothetical protein